MEDLVRVSGKTSIPVPCMLSICVEPVFQESEAIVHPPYSFVQTVSIYVFYRAKVYATCSIHILLHLVSYPF